MTTSNLLLEDGPRWHLFIRQAVTEEKMLNKAAWNLQVRKKAGVVHRHAANEDCNGDCDYLEPEGSEGA